MEPTLRGVRCPKVLADDFNVRFGLSQFRSQRVRMFIMHCSRLFHHLVQMGNDFVQLFHLSYCQTELLGPIEQRSW